MIHYSRNGIIELSSESIYGIYFKKQLHNLFAAFQQQLLCQINCKVFPRKQCFFPPGNIFQVFRAELFQSLEIRQPSLMHVYF